MTGATQTPGVRCQNCQHMIRRADNFCVYCGAPNQPSPSPQDRKPT